MTIKKTLSTEMSGNILDEFNEFVASNGYVKYRAVEAAMRAFMALPAEARVALMNDKVSQEHDLAIIADTVVDSQLAILLRPLPMKQKEQVLLSAKELRQKASRDK